MGDTMGTLVQSPDRASAEVSGLQPIIRPEGRGRLGTFLSGVLPAVNAELDEYDKGSRDRLIALGRNDELNGVLHDVSLLDRRNYQSGITYQRVVNGQIALTQKFQDDIDSADASTFDPDVLLKKGREFTDQSVTNIHDAKLPNEIKEALYTAQLKENATYMTMVDKKIKQITADNATTIRVNSTAELTRNLGTNELTASELAVNVEAFIEKRTLAMRLADPEMSLEDIKAEVSKDVDAAFTFNLDSIKTNGQPEDLVRLEYFSQVADSLVDTDLNLATKVQVKANKIASEIQTNQVARRKYEVNNFLDSKLIAPETWSKEETLDYVGKLFEDPSIPFDERAALSTSILSAYTKNQVAILNAETVLDPEQYTPVGFAALGKSEEELVKLTTAKFLNENPDNPAVAGLKLMHHFATMSDYSGAGVKRGSEIFFGSLIGYASMSDADVANDKFYEARQQQFAVSMQMYNKYRTENATKARDMLSGIDDRYIDAFASVYETGGTLEDVRRRFKDPVSVADKYKSMETVLNDTAGVTKALGLGSELLGGVDGVRSKSISDGLEPYFVDAVVSKITGAKAAFVNTAQMSTATSLIARYQKSGGFLPSPAGYSSAIMDINVAKQVQGYTVTGTNVPLNPAYIGAAIDAEKERYAKIYDTDASNVLAVSDATGQQMNFYVYESSGWRGKGDPVLKTDGVTGGAVSTSMAVLKNTAEKQYNEDNTRNASAAGQDSRYTNTRIGQAMIADHNTGKQSTININAHYANGIGGNLGLATIWVNHMASMEGFVTQRTGTKDANTGKQSYVYGFGATSATAQALKMEQEFINAQGNAQKTADVQGKFMQKYYSGFNTTLAKVGIPAPTSAIYPAQWTPSLMLAYDVKWHAGTIGRTGKNNQILGLSDALNAKSYAAGRKILQGLSTYNRKDLGSKRNRFMETALLAHFRARGVK